MAHSWEAGPGVDGGGERLHQLHLPCPQQRRLLETPLLPITKVDDSMGRRPTAGARPASCAPCTALGQTLATKVGINNRPAPNLWECEIVKVF